MLECRRAKRRSVGARGGIMGEWSLVGLESKESECARSVKRIVGRGQE
jgi:hypothetical protein